MSFFFVFFLIFVAVSHHRMVPKAEDYSLDRKTNLASGEEIQENPKYLWSSVSHLHHASVESLRLANPPCVCSQRKAKEGMFRSQNCQPSLSSFLLCDDAGSRLAKGRAANCVLATSLERHPNFIEEIRTIRRLTHYNISSALQFRLVLHHKTHFRCGLTGSLRLLFPTTADSEVFNKTVGDRGGNIPWKVNKTF